MLGVKDESDLPIPDEPRKRNTRGCSSSYQPFSFLLMAAETQRQNTIMSFICLCTQYSEFLQTEASWPEGDGYLRNYDKRVREQGWEKGQDICARDRKRETEERKQSRRARWETSRKLPTLPLFPPQSVGPLASSNCVSLPGAAMVKSV